MHEIAQFIIEHWGKPVTASSIAVLVLILIDKFGRRLITSQVKRLFHIQDKSEFKQYVENQRRIEKKINAIMQKEGIEWSGDLEIDTNGATNSSKSLPSSWETRCTARTARKSEPWRKNMTINKSILLPLLSAIALFVKQAFGYEISDENVDMAANGILLVVTIAGLFMHPKKEKKDDIFLQDGGQ